MRDGRSVLPSRARKRDNRFIFTTLGKIGIAMTGEAGSPSDFQMTESFDETGVLCLSLIGELDLSVADDLATRLQELHEQGQEVWLDLSRLEFIDSTGIRELMCALDSSRRGGSRLTVGTDMTRAVRRVVEVVGAGSYFRPDGNQRDERHQRPEQT